MSLTQTRPEKSYAMTELVGTLRNVIAEKGSTGELNLAECINSLAQVVSSILVGAYDKKNRDVVMSMFPDVVRAYYPQWEKIYRDHAAAVSAGQSAAQTDKQS